MDMGAEYCSVVFVISCGVTVASLHGVARAGGGSSVCPRKVLPYGHTSMPWRAALSLVCPEGKGHTSLGTLRDSKGPVIAQIGVRA